MKLVQGGLRVGQVALVLQRSRIGVERKYARSTQ